VSGEIYPFWVKIETWGSEIIVNGYDAYDAEGLARLLFKIPTDVKITARPKFQTAMKSSSSMEKGDKAR
jgi:hypothetical protein